MKSKESTKLHKHRWIRTTNNKPWLKSFGSDVTLYCPLCHEFTHVSEKDVDKIEAQTRL